MGDRQLNYREWKDTPYAKSDAKRSDEAIERLLQKYGVEETQWTQCRGPNGRKAVSIRFNLRGHTYHIAVESLDCPEAPEPDRIKQVKRAIFWMLKSALEAATVFFSAEEALYAFLELPDGNTMYEVSKNNIKQLGAANFNEMVWQQHKALPDK